jgi:hypothetical protein
VLFAFPFPVTLLARASLEAVAFASKSASDTGVLVVPVEEESTSPIPSIARKLPTDVSTFFVGAVLVDAGCRLTITATVNAIGQPFEAW